MLPGECCHHLIPAEEGIVRLTSGSCWCWQGGDGGSLLHVVCKENEVKMDLVKKLLERGLDATKRDQVTLTVVHYTSRI